FEYAAFVLHALHLLVCSHAPPPPTSPLFPYTTLFRSQRAVMNFVSKFRENPRSPGINYEVIRNARDKNFRSVRMGRDYRGIVLRSEEHTSELQSRFDLVCRLLLETKKNKTTSLYSTHE